MHVAHARSDERRAKGAPGHIRPSVCAGWPHQYGGAPIGLPVGRVSGWSGFRLVGLPVGRASGRIERPVQGSGNAARAG